MASAIETFETMLKEVVTSKRLSSSKMNSLSEYALKYMEMDTQLVSMLFLTHKSLQSCNKVNSLYVFDALARAAKRQVTKSKLTLPSEPDKGNSVTFLLKMEGVLDGLFKDLLAVADVPEMKEKMKKVLDIWTKAGTFSPDVLTRLSDLAKGSEPDQVANRTQTSVTDPRRPTKSPPVNGAVNSTTPPVSPPTDASAGLPPALLALLGAAAQGTAPIASGSQLTSATPGETSNYAVALLQQLAAAGGLVNGVTVPTAVQSAVPSSDPSPAVHGGVHNFSNGRDVDWQQRPPPPARFSQDFPDSRMNSRDEHGRRGQHGYRGRSADPRRGRSGASWHTGRGDSRTSYRDRSRSRSPPTYRRDDIRGRGRGARPYSPPHRGRNGMSPTTSHFPSSSSPPHSSQGGPGAGAVDEFGRDIPEPRAEEPNSVASHGSAPAARPTRFSFPPPPPRIPPSQPIPTFDSYESASSNLPTTSSPPQPSAVAPSKVVHNAPLLSQFDFTAFDFGSPESWEMLGASFEATNGYAPSQEEMMGILMMAMSSMAGPVDAASPSQNQTREGSDVSYMGQPDWGGPLGGENGHSARDAVTGYPEVSGQSEERQEQAQAGSYHDPNWNVPSGASPSTNDGAGSDSGPTSPAIEADGQSSRGGMKRIGDRWVWQQDA